MSEISIANYPGGSRRPYPDGDGSLSALRHPDKQGADSAPKLNQHHPFGITAIIGGTNVRFGVSVPGQQQPMVTSIKWQELNKLVAPQLEAEGRVFARARDLVYPLLAKHLVNFVASLCPESSASSIFDRLSAFNFSVAGRVAGSGLSAQISTTNTGLTFENEQIGHSIITAVNDELARRTWNLIPTHRVEVLNDAVAGMRGEMLYGGLKGHRNGLFVIVGTGIGSMGLVNGELSDQFSEAGHLFIRDLHQKRYIKVDLKEVVDDQGRYKSLPPYQYYAENDLAGPWAAIRFAKLLREHYEGAFFSLAERCARSLNRTPAEIEEELQRVIDFNYGELTTWGISSPSDLVKSINTTLFNPKAEDVFRVFPCDERIDDLVDRDADAGLTMLGLIRCKVYFKRLGDFLGEAYRDMEARAQAPEKIILGGGIGEHCSGYEPIYKREALRIIQHAARVPDGVVQFSEMNPVERESAVTTDITHKAYRDLEDRA